MTTSPSPGQSEAVERVAEALWRSWLNTEPLIKFSEINPVPREQWYVQARAAIAALSASAAPGVGEWNAAIEAAWKWAETDRELAIDGLTDHVVAHLRNLHRPTPTTPAQGMVCVPVVDEVACRKAAAKIVMDNFQPGPMSSQQYQLINDIAAALASQAKERKG